MNDMSGDIDQGSRPIRSMAGLPVPVQKLRCTILQGFASTGTAPTSSELGAGAGKALRMLADRDLIGLDEHGDIAYAYPFSASPTPHRIRTCGGVHSYAMCAVDALGIPAMLDTDAEIISADPHTGETIVVTVTGNGTIARWLPEDAVVFYGVIAEHCATTSAETQCGYVNFFASRLSAQAWADEHAGIDGRILEQDVALRMGAHYFGDLLA